MGKDMAVYVAGGDVAGNDGRGGAGGVRSGDAILRSSVFGMMDKVHPQPTCVIIITITIVVVAIEVVDGCVVADCGISRHRGGAVRLADAVRLYSTRRPNVVIR